METRQNANLPPICTVALATLAHHTVVCEKVVLSDLNGLFQTPESKEFVLKEQAL